MASRAEETGLTAKTAGDAALQEASTTAVAEAASSTEQAAQLSSLALQDHSAAVDAVETLANDHLAPLAVAPSSDPVEASRHLHAEALENASRCFLPPPPREALVSLGKQKPVKPPLGEATNSAL